MSEHVNFRQRLDQILRTRDVRQVRAFLVEEGQWSLDQPADPEYAMWLMIAGSPNLKDFHAEARQWLIQHGHSEAADAVAGRTHDGQGQQSRGKRGGQSRSRKGR